MMNNKCAQIKLLNKPSITMILIVSSLLIGCHDLFSRPYEGYVGDGQLVDYLVINQRVNQGFRYLVDFGIVDLTSPIEKTFDFSHLPEAKLWNVGLFVSPKIQNTGALIMPVIALIIEDQDGNTLMNYSGSLNTWLWQSDFEKGIGPAFVSGGKNTFFNPSSDSKYRLTIKVIRESDIADNFTVNLQLKGTNPFVMP